MIWFSVSLNCPNKLTLPSWGYFLMIKRNFLLFLKNKTVKIYAITSLFPPLSFSLCLSLSLSPSLSISFSLPLFLLLKSARRSTKFPYISLFIKNIYRFQGAPFLFLSGINLSLWTSVKAIRRDTGFEIVKDSSDERGWQKMWNPVWLICHKSGQQSELETTFFCLSESDQPANISRRFSSVTDVLLLSKAVDVKKWPSSNVSNKSVAKGK